MKKGISSQVFIYIFAVIVMALILFFGFKQIVGLKDLSDKSTYINFREDFREAVNGVFYKNKGSVIVFSLDSRNKPLVLPDNINDVCFEGNKVILVPEKYSGFEVDYLDGNECIKVVKDGLSFKLENMGELVEVSLI